jgi:hypothetical protein
MACQLLPSAAKGSRPLCNLLKVGKCPRRRSRLGRVPDLDKPGDATDQVDIPSIANSETGSRAMTAKLALINYFAQRRRVEQPT